MLLWDGFFKMGAPSLAIIIIHKSVQFEPVPTISDSNGRFVIVTGKLYNTSVILLSVYVPNWDNEEFFIRFFSNLPNVGDHYIIMHCKNDNYYL